MIVLLWLIILHPLIVNAKEEMRINPITSLTEQQAVRFAIEYNPELQSARLEAKKAHSRVLEAWSYTMPSIDASGQYTKAIKKPVFFLPGMFLGQPQRDVIAVEVGSTHSLSMGLTAKQLLFNGTVFIGVGASHIYAKAADEMYYGKKLEIIAKVRKAYYGVLLAKEALLMMQSNLKNAEENLKNVQLLRAQGVLSEYEELRAQVGVENIRPLVIQAETNYELALSSLSNLIGIPLSETTEITGTLEFVPYNEQILLSNPEEILLKANSNLHALRYQKEVNEAFVAAERSNYLPTIAAFGTYQYQSQKNKFLFSTNDLIASSQVGLQVSLNLFQGFQTYAKVQQAQIEVQKSEAQLVSVENSLRTALRAAIGTLQQAKKRIEAQTRTVETAERGYAIVSARFMSNASTQLEVNDAQLALTQAKVNRMQAIYDYLTAAADIDHLLGRLPEQLKDVLESDN